MHLQCILFPCRRNTSHMSTIPPPEASSGLFRLDAAGVKKGEERTIWPDVARIVCVFAVIMLHAAAAGFGIFGARTIQWQICNIYNAFSRFAVPVFVMISGMFLLNGQREYPIGKLFGSKILRIAVAYLFWATFYSILGVLESSSGEAYPKSSFLYAFFRGIVYGEFHLWFLYMITGLYVVTPFLRAIVKNERLAIYYLALGLFFCFGVNMLELFPVLRTPVRLVIGRLDINLFGAYSTYYVWGHWLARHSLSSLARRNVYLLGIASFLCTAGFNGLAGYYFNIPGTWMFNNLRPNILMMATAVFVFFNIA